MTLHQASGAPAACAVVEGGRARAVLSARAGAEWGFEAMRQPWRACES